MNILQNKELTSIPIIKPNIAPTKKRDTFTSFVTPYAIIVLRNRISRNEKYITNVEEYGLMNIVLIATRTAKITRNAAIKIVVYIVVRPKKSRCRPKTSMSIPIIIQLSLNTLQRLDTSKTGQPYLDLPQILIYFSVVSYFTSTKL